MKKIYIIFSLLFFLIFFIYSEPLTLEDCLQKAEKANPEIQKAKATLDAAAAKAFSITANFLPKFSIGGLYTHISDTPPEIDFSSIMSGVFPDIAGNPLLQYKFQDNYSGYIRINQPLFTSGRLFFMVRSSFKDYEAKEAELKLKLGRLKTEVIRTYYGIVVAEEMKKLSEEAIKQLERHLKTVKNLKDAGLATEYDILKTEVKLLTWKPKLKNTERELNNIKRKLNLIMGESDDAPIEIKGGLDYTTPQKITIQPDVAKEEALTKRPEIIAAIAAKDFLGEIKMAKISSSLPQVYLQYNYNFLSNRPDLALPGDNWEQWWDIRVMLNWDIFSFGTKEAEIKEAADAENAAKINMEAIKKSISAEIDDVFDMLEQAEDDVAVWGRNVELAQKGFDIASEKYKNGTITNTEFLDSHLALMEAKAQYLMSLYNLKTAESEYNRILAR